MRLIVLYSVTCCVLAVCDASFLPAWARPKKPSASSTKRIKAIAASTSKIVVSVATSAPTDEPRRLISQQKGYPIPPEYEQQEKKPTDPLIRLYIIDSGANPQHRTYLELNRRYKITWWDPQNTWGKRTQTLHEDLDGHGACMLSLACSQELGVAEDANVTIIKDEPPTLAKWMTAYQWILRDVKDNDLQGKAVVLHAAEAIGELDDQEAKEWYESLANLTTAGIVFVTTAGNIDEEEKVS